MSFGEPRGNVGNLEPDPNYESLLRECIKQITLLSDESQQVGVAKVMRALLRSANRGAWNAGSLDNPELTGQGELAGC